MSPPLITPLPVPLPRLREADGRQQPHHNPRLGLPLRVVDDRHDDAQRRQPGECRGHPRGHPRGQRGQPHMGFPWLQHGSFVGILPQKPSQPQQRGVSKWSASSSAGLELKFCRISARNLGCTLPVHLWCKLPGVQHPLVHALWGACCPCTQDTRFLGCACFLGCTPVAHALRVAHKLSKLHATWGTPACPHSLGCIPPGACSQGCMQPVAHSPGCTPPVARSSGHKSSAMLLAGYVLPPRIATKC